MALTNIFREPRREITETVVGAAPTVIFLYTDYRFARWLENAMPPDNPICWELGMVVGGIGFVMVLLLIVLLLVIIHLLGELFCDLMGSHDPRPALRPGRASPPNSGRDIREAKGQEL